MSSAVSVLADTENNTMVRAKMKCCEIATSDAGNGATNEVVKLTAVYGPGNETWSKYTPSGQVSLCITNPEAVRQFKVGAAYFVDFTPANG
mgnify:FL=1